MSRQLATASISDPPHSIVVPAVAAFIVTWVVAFAIYKVRRIDERWAALIDDMAEVAS